MKNYNMLLMDIQIQNSEFALRFFGHINFLSNLISNVIDKLLFAVNIIIIMALC